VRGDATEMNAAAADLDEEEHVKAAEPGRLHGERSRSRAGARRAGERTPPTFSLTAWALVAPDATASPCGQSRVNTGVPASVARPGSGGTPTLGSREPT
jgi:hypothetical protein